MWRLPAVVERANVCFISMAEARGSGEESINTCQRELSWRGSSSGGGWRTPGSGVEGHTELRSLWLNRFRIGHTHVLEFLIDRVSPVHLFNPTKSFFVFLSKWK